MKKILAIGNSFSQDATAYLHQVAEASGVESKVVNLYIGGCSLQTHWNNAENDLENYEYELNGVRTHQMISIRKALLEEEWDVVTLQQVSGDSGVEESYHPYLQKVYDYVVQYAPKAEIYIHQTWAYEKDSDHGKFVLYQNDQKKMHECLKNAYLHAAQQLGVLQIPCGEIIDRLRSTPEFDYSNGQPSLCRDGFHLNLVYGRYAAAAAWMETLCEKSILENDFLPPSEQEIDEDKIQLIRKTVHEVCEEYRSVR